MADEGAIVQVRELWSRRRGAIRQAKGGQYGRREGYRAGKGGYRTGKQGHRAGKKW